MKLSIVARVLVVFGMFLSFQARSLSAADTGAEEMLFGDVGTVAGVITRISKENMPVSLTTITAEDIRLTPARNLLDLIETYVPGATWSSYYEGSFLGIRGLISDRANKYLLQINGVNINQKAQNGGETEIENWDMNDIDRVEIIRGPGSVTYGPGAVSGVINIITKNADTDSGTEVGTLTNFTYRSEGVHVSHGQKWDKASLYLYGSVVGSKGVTPHQYTADNANHVGTMGTSDLTGNQARQPQSLFRDYDGKRQYKLYAQVDFLRDWKYWLRYTNSGGPRFIPHVPTAGASPGDTHGNWASTLMEQVTTSLENKHSFTDAFQLQSRLTAFSENHLRRAAASYGVYNPTEGVDDVANMVQAFSETQAGIRSLGNYVFSPKYDASIGAEYFIERFGAPWGRGKNQMVMGENPYLGGANPTIISGPMSDYHVYQPTFSPSSNVYYVGSGWTTSTLSFMGEVNFKFHPLVNVLLSCRTDKNSYTHTMVSPRAALVSGWDDGSVTKLIAQKSVRANTATQLFIQRQQSINPKPEKFDSLEFIYDKPNLGAYSLSASAFYDRIQVLSWNGTTVAMQGDLHLYGAELEAKRETPRWTIGANHAVTKQISFKPAPGVTQASLITNSYYNGAGNPALHGAGNSLDNWPDQSTKLFTKVKVTDKLTVHADARYFWSYRGMRDGVTLVENAATNPAAASAEVSRLNGKRYGKSNYTGDLSADYRFTDKISATAYAMNLAGYGYKRYMLEDISASGGTSFYKTLGFLEEPFAFGMNLEYKF